MRLINMRRLLGGLLIAAFAVSCTSSKPGVVHLGPPQLQVAGDPLQLVGSWQIADASQADGSVLILGSDLRVFTSCGDLEGAWRADRYGRFIGEIWGGSGACFGHGPHPADVVPWLDRAAGYRIDGSNPVLLDDRQRVIARLEPGAHPTPGPDIDPSLASPPVITPDLRSQLSEPDPLPAGTTAASASDLLGRWQAVGAGAGNAKGFVKLDSSGKWIGSDGCNGWGGRYALGPGGELLAFNGPVTAVGCDGSQAPSWFSEARRVAISGGRLILFDAHAKQLGLLAKSG